jgi:hypothetical protein
MKCWKVRARVKQVLRVDGWEDVTMGDNKPNAYTFTKNAGPQFNPLPDAEPMDYYSLFFSNELLNNTVIDTKFQNFSLAQGPFGAAGLMCQFLK